MAEDTGELWKHIGDLHRKHSELAIQMHDKQTEKGESEGGMQEMHAAVMELTSAVKELTAVMKSDTQADKADTKGDKTDTKADKGENGTGRRKQPGA